MGIHCYIIGCSNESGRCKASFFRLPAIITNQGEKTDELSTRRRRTWLSRISRSDLTSLSYVRVCSDHFVNGKPSPLYPEHNVDWAPSLNLGHQKVTPSMLPTPHRGERMMKREEKKKNVDAARSLLELFKSQPLEKEIAKSSDLEADDQQSESYESSDTKLGVHAVQTELSAAMISAIETDYNRITVENIDLKRELNSAKLTEEGLKGNNERVKMLTGLPTFTVLFTLFNFIEPALVTTHSSVLTKFQQVMLVLIRLKLAFPVQYLAEMFGISSSTVSKIFLNVLNTMYVKMKPLIYWPQREELQETMPMEFRKYF